MSGARRIAQKFMHEINPSFPVPVPWECFLCGVNSEKDFAFIAATANEMVLLILVCHLAHQNNSSSCPCNSPGWRALWDSFMASAGNLAALADVHQNRHHHGEEQWRVPFYCEFKSTQLPSTMRLHSSP